MTDAVVGVKQATAPDVLVDNGQYVNGAGQTVVRQRVEDVRTVGTPAYTSGTGGGTVTVPAGGKLLGISAFGYGGDGTFTVNGGAAITVRSLSTFGWNPLGNLIAPTIVFSSQLDYFVEWVV